MKHWSILFSGCAAAALLAAPAMAAGYLKLDGVDGDVSVKGREKWIEITGFSAVSEASTGRAAGPALGPIRIRKEVDVTTPLLATALSSKRLIPEARIEYVDAAGRAYLTVVMNGVRVASARTAAGSAQPTEEVSFYYNKITFQYARDGAKGGNVEFEWKVEEGES